MIDTKSPKTPPIQNGKKPNVKSTRLLLAGIKAGVRQSASSLQLRSEKPEGQEQVMVYRITTSKKSEEKVGEKELVVVLEGIERGREVGYR